MNEYLRRYMVAVKYPNVSGFEHLDMLMVRDKLAARETELTEVENQQLKQADNQLLSNARAFHNELARVTELAREREQRTPPPDHWWWYLDVIVKLPAKKPLAA